MGIDLQGCFYYAVCNDGSVGHFQKKSAVGIGQTDCRRQNWKSRFWPERQLENYMNNVHFGERNMQAIMETVFDFLYLPEF